MSDRHCSNFKYTGSTQYGVNQNVFIRIVQVNSPDLNNC